MRRLLFGRLPASPGARATLDATSRLSCTTRTHAHLLCLCFQLWECVRPCTLLTLRLQVELIRALCSQHSSSQPATAAHRLVPPDARERAPTLDSHFATVSCVKRRLRAAVECHRERDAAMPCVPPRIVEHVEHAAPDAPFVAAQSRHRSPRLVILQSHACVGQKRAGHVHQACKQFAHIARTPVQLQSPRVHLALIQHVVHDQSEHARTATSRRK
mmetsp:Transcript_11211/g.35704  ORF Transcript_11211/g.35704 Transcript_11211/m.35704 type:complete len:216 (-) Transcript_11211:1530-2177(-)